MKQNDNQNAIEPTVESNKLTKIESNKSLDSNPTPSKSIKQSPKSEIKSELKSGSEIQSEYENTFESLGDVLKGSRDMFNEPVHLTKEDTHPQSDSKYPTHDDEPHLDHMDNADFKITHSAEDPFNELLSINNSNNNDKSTKSKTKSKHDSRYNLRYEDEDEDDFSDRNHESVHMPLQDDDDMIDEGLNQLNRDDIINSNVDDPFQNEDNDNDNDNGELQFNKMGSFNKTLKGSDLKAMTNTLKSSNEDGSDSGSEDDCIVSDRNLD